ncbi:hypothetical protein FD47_GL000920 [Lentilactobacillus parafarraginis DSM 18390 = JCM 14109]|uniref:Uncharacterized protein n=1 Tax=Lentilactobacillus parafarraginis DSM 18390 = JCM 14109 TaxID=1423786 RepID=A0A0R1YV01_9LACO|nr:hypothetical protein FD47_GL000920 [Lentilactobacillus parafarraginis DSM 18390 = JCM 14109]
MVGALLVAVGIFSVLEFFIHYRYGKTFFKKHPELDLHNFESTIMSNFVVFVGIIGIVVSGYTMGVSSHFLGVIWLILCHS